MARSLHASILVLLLLTILATHTAHSFAVNETAATTDLSTTHARFGGSPDASARHDSTQLAPIPAKHSSVQHIECGVTMSFSFETASSGLSAGGGSVSKTSMAAPAMMLRSNACSKSASLTIGPRAVLIKYLRRSKRSSRVSCWTSPSYQQLPAGGQRSPIGSLLYVAAHAC